MGQIVSESLTRRKGVVGKFLARLQREVLHEPSRNDTPLTALVQFISKQRFLIFVCLMLDISLPDVFPDTNNHPYQFFFRGITSICYY